MVDIESLFNFLEIEELEDFWNALSEEVKEIKEQNQKNKAIKDFEFVFSKLIKSAIKKMVLSEDHLTFIDTQDEISDDQIDEYEKKNK